MVNTDFKTFADARKYGLISNLRLFSPGMKVKCNRNC